MDLLTYLLCLIIFTCILCWRGRQQESAQSAGDWRAVQFSWQRRRDFIVQQPSPSVHDERAQHWRSPLGQWSSGVVGNLFTWGWRLSRTTWITLLHIHVEHLHIHIGFCILRREVPKPWLASERLRKIMWQFLTSGIVDMLSPVYNDAIVVVVVVVVVVKL